MRARLEYLVMLVAAVVVANLLLYLMRATYPNAVQVSLIITLAGFLLAAFILFVPERR